MRGTDERSGSLFSYVDLEARVPADHPLRAIREIVNAALAKLAPILRRYMRRLGRPSIAPEKLLRASLLQAFYSIRSERQLMERLEFDLLFRWFVGLGIDDAVWDHSVFSKNRDRLLEGEIAARFLAAVLTQPGVKRLLSSEHFSVDGTLVEAWASMKSLKPRDGSGGGDPPAGGGRNAEVDFHGQKRGNDTHVSASDPDAMLYRKGPGMEAKLCFIGHALMENRNGLFVDARLTRVSGRAERLAALDMIAAHADRPNPITLGGDKGYDAADFVMELREINVTPHIARNTSRRSAIDGRTTRHPGYAASPAHPQADRGRLRLDEDRRRLAQDQVPGDRKGRMGLHPCAAAYNNLIRLPKLMAADMNEHSNTRSAALEPELTARRCRIHSSISSAQIPAFFNSLLGNNHSGPPPVRTPYGNRARLPPNFLRPVPSGRGGPTVARRLRHPRARYADRTTIETQNTPRHPHLPSADRSWSAVVRRVHAPTWDASLCSDPRRSERVVRSRQRYARKPRSAERTKAISMVQNPHRSAGH